MPGIPLLKDTGPTMRTVAVLLLSTLLLGACSKPDQPSIPLSLAIQRGDVDQLERHMYWGTDMETPDANGQRPLHIAAERGNVVIVRKLLDHGVQIDAPDAAGHTALQLAVLAGRTQAADLLLKRGARLDADALLLAAARAGTPDRDVVRYLVKHGADTETRGPDGDTPLLLAVCGRHLRLARHLVDAGADVNVRDAKGVSALALARRNGANELASMLERYGARIQGGGSAGQ